jgi:hypothetical protein
MRQPEAEGVLLICYPPDETFENGIRTVIDDLGGWGHSSVESVELRLHERFPNLRIVVHEPLAAGDTGRATWTVTSRPAVYGGATVEQTPADHPPTADRTSSRHRPARPGSRWLLQWTTSRSC